MCIRDSSKSSLVNALFNDYPVYANHFNAFINNVLSAYQKHEEIDDGSETDWTLVAFASNIRSLTHQWLPYYTFDIPKLIVSHPSLISYSASISAKEKCVKMNAIDLEKALDLLETNLSSGAIYYNVKAKWEEPLQKIAGNLYGGGTNCLNQLISSYSKDLAEELLEEYY